MTILISNLIAIHVEYAMKGISFYIIATQPEFDINDYPFSILKNEGCEKIQHLF